MIALLLNRYVLGLIGVAALSLLSLFAWSHFVAEPYREAGRAQGRSELLPTLKTATAQLDRDTAAFGEITKAFAVLKANSERLRTQAAQAQKVKIVRQEVEKTRVEYIDRFAPAGDTECERTTDAIKRVLR